MWPFVLEEIYKIQIYSQKLYNLDYGPFRIEVNSKVQR